MLLFVVLRLPIQFLIEIISSLNEMNSTRIAILASGAGTNAQNIIQHFRNDLLVEIVLVAGNNQSAGIVEVAASNNIPFLLLQNRRFKVDGYLEEFEMLRINMIVLAGFLLRVPDILIKRFSNRILNIHPSLLPNYGGPGMYGMKVHEAVISASEKESGITIHQVDEIYDHGNILFQAKCIIDAGETASSLSKKVRLLELQNYPQVVSQYISR